jgi:hypothetical protein
MIGMLTCEFNFEVRQVKFKISSSLQREVSGGQALQTCRTGNLNPRLLTPHWSQRPLALDFGLNDEQ